jgi:prophage tail gpP-like protein
MTLSIRLNGENYSNFTTAEVTRDMETACSKFSFGATVGLSQFRSNFIPIRANDEVEIVVDDQFKIITGFVDEEGVEYDQESHTIPIKGRSKTQDVVDCTVGPLKEFEKITVFDICKLVASDFNIDVIDQIGDTKPLLDIAGAEVGQTAFKFIESLARKRQVLITDDGEGRLVLIRASQNVSPNNLQNKIDGINNNIKSASRSANFANLFHEYIAQSQLSPINVSDFETPQDLAEEAGFAIDPEVRGTRRLEFYTEETTESFTLEDRAKWELSVRRARNFTYRATVQGHSFNGFLWEPNILHQIDDDFAGVYGKYLLKKVVYKYDLQNGAICDLFFTNRNSFTLDATKDRILIEYEEG